MQIWLCEALESVWVRKYHNALTEGGNVSEPWGKSRNREERGRNHEERGRNREMTCCLRTFDIFRYLSICFSPKCDRVKVNAAWTRDIFLQNNVAGTCACACKFHSIASLCWVSPRFFGGYWSTITKICNYVHVQAKKSFMTFKPEAIMDIFWQITCLKISGGARANCSFGRYPCICLSGS